MSLIDCDIGDELLIRGTLTDEAGDPVSGAAVTARVLHGDVETPLGPAADQGGGVYSVTFAPTASGTWHVRFDSADPNLAAEEGIIGVRATRFAT